MGMTPPDITPHPQSKLDCDAASRNLGKAVLQYQKGLITIGEMALLIKADLAIFELYAEPGADVLILGDDGFISLANA